MTWTELLAQAAGVADSADSADRTQVVLDAGLAAVAAARSTWLDAQITAELPTVSRLCALLDAHGVRVPGPVAARVCWHATPQAAHAQRPAPVPQDLHPVRERVPRPLGPRAPVTPSAGT